MTQGAQGDEANGFESLDADAAAGFEPTEGPRDAAAQADAEAGFEAIDADASADAGLAPAPPRPMTVRRVICPDCRALVEVRGAPNEKGRVHVQCGACGRQALIPAAPAAAKA